MQQEKKINCSAATAMRAVGQVVLSHCWQKGRHAIRPCLFNGVQLYGLQPDMQRDYFTSNGNQTFSVYSSLLIA